MLFLLPLAAAIKPWTVCTLVRDEKVEYLDEWIDFHLRQGVGRIVLYDDHSLDRTPLLKLEATYPQVTVVSPFPEGRQALPGGDPPAVIDNLKQCTDFIKGGRRGYPPHNGRPGLSFSRCQAAAFEDCVFRYKNDSSWLANYDVDEFVYPCPPLTGTLLDVLESNRVQFNVSSVRMQCLRFGPNGHLNAESPLLTTHTHRAPYADMERDVYDQQMELCDDKHQPCFHKGCESTGTFKVISYAANVIEIRSPHHHDLVEGSVQTLPVAPGSHGGFCCNHYQFRSFDAIQKKATFNSNPFIEEQLAAECFGQVGVPGSGWFGAVEDQRIFAHVRGSDLRRSRRRVATNITTFS